jgi:hypothetical protein
MRRSLIAGWAALFLSMSFSYQFGANPQIDYVRLLIPDTDSTNPIFQDSEILAFANLTTLVWQSSMFWSGPQGVATLPSPPTNYLRAAALALDSLAGNSARLAAVIQLLDVKLSADKAAVQLRAQATEYRTVDDESGAFAIIEQVPNEWAFRDRFWSQVQRTSAL